MNYTDLQNVNPEIRAYIYQQLADLEQLIPEGSEISIVINDGVDKKIETNIKIETPFGEVHALESSADIYESLAQAKENLVKQLSEIHRAIGGQEVENMMNAIAEKRLIH